MDQKYVLRICYSISIFLACFGFSSLYIPGLETKMGIINYNDGGPMFLAFFVLYLAEPIYAFRLMLDAMAASSPLRRAHITYVMSAGVVGFLMGAAWFPLCFDVPISPIFGCFVWLYCLLVTWAVFKYQLFDIRVVIRRSLVYSILVSFLTIGYFGLVHGVERLFQSRFGYRSLWISLSSFALMALIFQPLKVGIQRVIDRLFFRAPREELVRRVERYEQESLQTEKLKAVATMAAGLCHELRNPLQVIQTHAEYLSDRSGSPQFIEACSRVMRAEIARISGLLKDLMDFAKPKSPNFQWLEPNQVVESTLDLLSNEFVARQVNLEKHHGADGVKIKADSDQLRQVVLNLVLNALQAVEPKGQVKVATGQENGWFTLEIADTGSGIDPTILPKLFEPFHTTKPGGTGLGLSVVHSIVREHRGEIVVQTNPKQGTTFTIKLPL